MRMNLYILGYDVFSSLYKSDMYNFQCTDSAQSLLTQSILINQRTDHLKKKAKIYYLL